MRNNYGFCRNIPLAYADAVPTVTAALQKEGFGVLTQIDVRETFKHRLGVDYKPYVILGACHPDLAYQGLEVEPELGLLLPCNVVVYDAGDGTSTICIADPIQTMDIANNPELQPLAREANRRLWRVFLELVVMAPSALNPAIGQFSPV